MTFRAYQSQALPGRRGFLHQDPWILVSQSLSSKWIPFPKDLIFMKGKVWLKPFLHSFMIRLLQLFAFYKWRKYSSERWSHLPQITWQIITAFFTQCAQVEWGPSKQFVEWLHHWNKATEKRLELTSDFKVSDFKCYTVFAVQLCFKLGFFELDLWVKIPVCF